MMNCVALEIQKNFRDLIQLPKLVDDVSWLSTDEIENAGALAIICALWLSDEPETASRVLLSRSNKGKATLIVPRFAAGDIGTLLGAPSEIKVETADFETMKWHDGSLHKVSGVTYINTALHTGRIGSIGLGVVVLCYRPNTAAGPIILCTASQTGRPSGVKLTDQKKLFVKIIDEIGDQTPAVEIQDSNEPESPAETLKEFLLHTGEQGAGFLLMYLAAGGEESKIPDAATKLGMKGDTNEFQKLLQVMPDSSIDEVTSILKQHGWGAYLRRIQNIKCNGETP